MSLAISSRSRALTLSLLTIAVASCTASLDLERFRKASDPVGGTGTDASTLTTFAVRFKAEGLQSHLDEHFEIRVVDKDNRVRCKAVYTDITRPDLLIYMPNAVPKANAPYRLDFWADHNKSFQYDGIVGGVNEKDHAWRRVLAEPLPEDVHFTNGQYDLSFFHDTAFVDIFTDLEGNKISGEETLLPFHLQITGAGLYAGKMIEVRLVEKTGGRLVALHRRGRVTASYSAEVAGVLDEETPYEASIHVDMDGDDRLSTGDPTWRVPIVSTNLGIDREMNLETLPAGEGTSVDP